MNSRLKNYRDGCKRRSMTFIRTKYVIFAANK